METPAAVIGRADEILAGRVPIWETYIEVGAMPAWHADPVSGYAWPLDRAVEIFPPQGPPGALRRVWELNRMGWLYDLACAFRATGLDEYRLAGWRHILGWVQSNAAGSGVNWTSGLEMAVRVVAWLAFIDISGSTPPPGHGGRFWRSVAQQTRNVAWHLSLRPRPNNHLAGEALLMLAVGSLCPWLPGANAWARLGRDLLGWAVDSCVLHDGTPAEGSLSYLMFVLEIYWLAGRILSHAGLRPFPRHVADRLAAGQRILADLRRRAAVPCLGDGDEATLFPWLPSLPRRAGWLEQALASPRSPTLRVPEPTTAGLGFPDTACDAWAVSTRRDYTMLCAVGRLGLPPAYGHGHAHALSVLLWLRGKPVFVDAGTYSYSEQPWRDYFRSTAAHSTVEVEGVSQAVPRADFQWSAPYACHARTVPHPEAFIVRGSHDGYLRLPQRVRHDRRVELSQDTLQVEDSVCGHSAFAARLHWHLHPAWGVATAGERDAVLTDGLDSLYLQIDGPGRLAVHFGSLNPLLGWYSPVFGQKLPTTTLRIEAEESAIRWTTSLRRA